MAQYFYAWTNFIGFELNAPNPEDPYITETFDVTTKRSVYTCGINEFLERDNIPEEAIETAKFILLKLMYFAKEYPLDYLQKITINGTKAWVIDDGYNITLLFPEDY